MILFKLIPTAAETDFLDILLLRGILGTATPRLHHSVLPAEGKILDNFGSCVCR